MKTLKLTGVLCLSLLFFFNSCKKDPSGIVSDDNNSSLQLQVSKVLSDFELIELNPKELMANLESQSGDQKSLVLKPGQYEFLVSKPSSHDKVIIEDEETGKETTIDLSNVQYENSADKANPSVFTIYDGVLNGSFRKDNQEYVLQKTSDFVENAPSESYVIYKTKNQSPSVNEKDITDINAQEKYADKDNTSSSNQVLAGTKTIKVGLFSDYKFRSNFSSTSACTSYILSAFNRTKQLFAQGNMPVVPQLERIKHFRPAAISWTSDMKKLNGTYFNAYLAGHPRRKSQANILYTAGTNYRADASGRVCRNSVACASVRFDKQQTWVQNFTAHELAALLGCKHKNHREGYAINIMNGTCTPVICNFLPASRSEMVQFVNKYGSCLR